MKIGIMELVVIFIVALFAFGPDKLPLYAKKLGEALAQFRKYSSEVTKDIKESIVEPLEEAQRPLREAMEPLEELNKEVKSSVKEVQDSFANIGKPSKKKEPEPAKEEAGPTPEEPEQPQAPEDDPHDALRQEADAAAQALEELGTQAAAPQDAPEQTPDAGTQPAPVREEPGPAAEQTENEPKALEKEEIV